MTDDIYVYDNAIREIDRIEFDIFGNDEIKRSSVLGKDSIGIDVPDLYDNLEPKKGGLIDARLGTTNNNIDCATCGLNTMYCVGHFGHIALAESVFHLGFMPIVKKILSCLCFRDSTLLVNKTEDEISEILKHKFGKARLTEIKNLSKNITHCKHCGTPVSKIKIDTKKSTNTIVMYAETFVPESGDGEKVGKKKLRRILTPDICRDILSHISDTTCKILGMNPERSRPEMLIYDIFPYPPVHIRPSVKKDASSAPMEDDLTHKLADIVKCNNRIIKHKETLNDVNEKYSQDHLCLLQYHLVTYYDNETNPLPKSEQKGKVVNALSSRLKGKTGRIRGNLEGKRGDHSGRCVITPNPFIKINELNIPLNVAMNLTKTITVTKENIEKLQIYVNNGKYKYPGANFYSKASFKGEKQNKFHLGYKKNVSLNVGDVVERHLLDGDYVLFNRQPTLHKQSMMAHKIRVMMNPEQRTFKMNPCITTPYGAD